MRLAKNLDKARRNPPTSWGRQYTAAWAWLPAPMHLAGVPVGSVDPAPGRSPVYTWVRGTTGCAFHLDPTNGEGINPRGEARFILGGVICRGH